MYEVLHQRRISIEVIAGEKRHDWESAASRHQFFFIVGKKLL
jgi:hypothetical protein